MWIALKNFQSREGGCPSECSIAIDSLISGSDARLAAIHESNMTTRDATRGRFMVAI